MDKTNIEKALKRFVKKKLGFTTALLVSFLITGELNAQAASGVPTIKQLDAEKIRLLRKLNLQEKQLLMKLRKNEAEIKKIEAKEFGLVKKADYLAKPMGKTNQVIFLVDNIESGKNKNITKKRFKETLEAAEKAGIGISGSSGITGTVGGSGASGTTGAGGSGTGVATPPTGTGVSGATGGGTTTLSGTGTKTPLDRLIAGNGAIMSAPPQKLQIDLGLNIVPVTPKEPNVNVGLNVAIDTPSATKPTMPKVNSPTLPKIKEPEDVSTPTIGSIVMGTIGTSTPTVPHITKPNIGQVNVQPLSIEAVSQPTAPNITVNPITLPQVTPPTAPTAPTAPQINISVTAPTAPSIPMAPSIPTVVVPAIPTFSIVTAGSGNQDGAWFWDKYGQNGLMSEVIVKKGTFDFKVYDSSNGYDAPYDATVQNYEAETPYSGTSQYIVSNGSKTTNTTINIPSLTTTGISKIGYEQMGIYRVIGSSYSAFKPGTIVNITNTRSNTTNGLRQFIHLDPHGNNSETLEDIKNHNQMSQDEYTALKNEKNKIDTVIGNSLGNNKFVTLSLMGDINIKGNTMNVVGAQGHYEGADYIGILNSGNISIKGDKNIVLGYVKIDDDTSYPGAPKRDRRYIATNTGNISINGNNNAVVVFDRRAGTNHMQNFNNDGTIIINGNNNTGLAVSKNIHNGLITLNKAIELSGDNNIGILHDDKADDRGQIDVNNNNINKASILKADISSGKNNVGYIEKHNGQQIKEGTFNITGGTSNIGIVADAMGTVVNSGTIIIGNTPTNSIGIVVNGNGTAKDIVYKGNLDIDGANTGVALTGKSAVDLGGTVTLKGNSTGAYLKDGNNTLKMSNPLSHSGALGTNIFVDGGSGDSITLAGDLNTSSGSGNQNTGVAISNNGNLNFGYNINVNNSKDTGVSLDNSTLTMSGKNITVTGSQATGAYLAGNTTNLTVGKIDVNTDGVGVYLKEGTAIVNGDINANNAKSTALYAKKGTFTGDLNINGAQTTGVYLEADNPTDKLTLTKALNVNNSGSVGVYGKKGTLDLQQNMNVSTDAVGIYLDGDVELSNGKVIVNGTSNGVGLYVNSGSFKGVDKLDIEGTKNVGIYIPGTSNFAINENLTIKGGENVGLYATKNSSSNAVTITGNGKIITDRTGLTGNGDIGVYVKDVQLTASSTDVESKGESNTGLYLSNSGFAGTSGNNKVELNKILLAGKKNTGIFNNDGDTTVTVTDKVEINGDTDGSVGIYSKAGNVKYAGNIEGNNLNDKAKITGAFASTGGKIDFSNGHMTLNGVQSGTGVTDKGVTTGLFADGSGTKITAHSSNIKLTEGAGGLIATNGGEIDFNGGTLDFQGHNYDYAIYADSNSSKIDLTGSTLKLSGKAIGFYKDMNATPAIKGSPTISVTGSEVIVGSLANIGTQTLSGLQHYLDTNVGTVSNLNGSKLALLDGGILNIDANMKKYDTTDTNGDLFYNKLLTQGLQLKVTNNAVVTAVGSETGNVIALSQGKGIATTGQNPSITIDSGAKVIADNNSIGKGAIGAFVKEGSVTNSGTVEVEKASNGNGANAGGVGLYAEEGKVTNENSGKIYVDGTDAVGMYTNSITADATVENKGTVEVTDGVGISAGATRSVANTKLINSGTIKAKTGIYAKDIDVDNTGTVEAMAKGTAIYGDNSNITLNNSSKLIVGTNGVGVTGINNSKIGSGDIGTIQLADASTGINLENGKLDLNGVTAVKFIQDTSNSNTKTSVGINANSNLTLDNLTLDISGVTHGVGIVSNDGVTLGNTGTTTVKVGDQGVGVVAKNNSNIIGANTTIDLSTGTGSVGVMGDGTGTNTTIDNKGKIDVKVAGGMGIYAKSISNPINVENSGTITLDYNALTTSGNSPIGIYAEGSDVKLGTTTPINLPTFGTNAKKAIGVYTKDGATVNVVSNQGITSDNANSNTLIYSDKANVNIGNGGAFTVDGVSSPTGSERTVGVYLDGTKGGNSLTFTNETLTVKNQAIGVYSSGTSNTINNFKSDVVGDNTFGLFSEDSITLAGTTNIGATDKGVGVYMANGILTLPATTLDLKATTAGTTATGIYLGGGSSISASGALTIQGNGTDKVIGIYHDSSATSNSINTINITGTNNIGTFLANGKTLTDKATTIISGTDSVGTLVGSGSNYTFAGTSNISSGDKNIGIYSEENSQITNTGTIDVKGATTYNAGVVLQGKTVTTKFDNKGNINATKQNAVGVYLGKHTSASGVTNELTNTGTITADTGAIGIYTKGDSSHISIGKVKTTGASSVAVYLEGTNGGTVQSAGALDLDPNTVGIYAKDSVVDFDIDTTTSSSGKTGYIGAMLGGASSPGTTVGNDIRVGNDATAVVLENEHVAFTKSSGLNKIESQDGIGIYAKLNSNYNIKNVDLNAHGGTGIYLENDETTTSPATQGTTMKFSGKINVDAGGTGVYVTEKSTFESGANGLDVIVGNQGTGFFVQNGGTLTLGNLGPATIDLHHGTGIYNDNGTLNITSVTWKGSGTRIATLNGDVTNSSDMNLTTGDFGVVGNYNTSLTTDKTITNTGNLTIKDGAVGIIAADKSTAGAYPHSVTIKNSGDLDVSGKDSSGNSSVGIITQVASVVNTGKIKVGDDAVGIYGDVTATGPTSADYLLSIDNSGIELTGDNATGIYVKNKFKGFINNNITTSSADKKGQLGVGFENADIENDTVNVGTIKLGKESVGIYSKNTDIASLTSDITLEEGSNAKKSIGLITESNAGNNVTIDQNFKLHGKDNTIAIYNDGATLNIGDVTGINIGKDSTYGYLENGTINLDTQLNVDGQQTGFVVKNNGDLNFGTNGKIAVKNGGVGVIVDGTFPTGTTAIDGSKIDVQIGTASHYSIGVYYKDTNNTTTPGIADLGGVTQSGNYTVGNVLDNSTGKMTNPITISSGNNNVAVLVKNNGVLTMNGVSGITGTSNIGAYSDGSGTITNTGNVVVGATNSSTDPNIGIYGKGGTITNTGDVSVDKDSIGLGTENGTIVHSGNVSATKAGTGIYGKGGTINYNGGTLDATYGGIGVYSRGGVINYNGGNITVGNGTTTEVSMGIGTTGGTINHTTGDFTLGDESIAFYGTKGLNLTTGTGTKINFTGMGGYGIYYDGQGVGTGTIVNNTDMNLGTAGIGIYTVGNATTTNNGKIVVGDSYLANVDHNITAGNRNSVGVYIANGATLENSTTGNIVVDKEHSVGAYVLGGTTSAPINSTFVNKGTIHVDNGGVGVLTRGAGAHAINEGTINLGSGVGSCYDPGKLGMNVGMGAYGNSTITNATSGTINVDNGVAMVVDTSSTLENYGVINLNGADSVGISGNGNIINSGQININATGARDKVVGDDVNIGSIKISNNTVYINDKVVAAPGSVINMKGTSALRGVYVDVTGKLPVFKADAHSDPHINILPNFAGSGDGILYQIDNFASVVSGGIGVTKPTVSGSPLFVYGQVGNNLVMVKKPYADLPVGKQFEPLYKGLDNILAGGSVLAPQLNGNTGSKEEDREILKKLDAYLGDVYKNDPQHFEDKVGEKLSEFRGDIYSTIQKRMENMNDAFDNSFDELENTYNTSKDSGKYSVIYRHGDFKDPTIGIDDYDYNVTGLMYMKEYEGTKIGEKKGYHLAFAVGQFDFKDAGESDENIYSLRAGAHRKYQFRDDLTLLSKVDGTFNIHDTNRKLDLDFDTVSNDALYYTGEVSFDNKLTKTLYEREDRNLNLYGGFKLGYGKIKSFDEDGNLELKVKDNDYYRVQPRVGVEGSYKHYLGRSVTARVTADANYSYECGEVYDANKAKVKDGKEGYYTLITPEKEEGKFTGKVGVTIENANRAGVTFEVKGSVADDKDDKGDIGYGVRFNYTF